MQKDHYLLLQKNLGITRCGSDWGGRLISYPFVWKSERGQRAAGRQVQGAGRQDAADRIDANESRSWTDQFNFWFSSFAVSGLLSHNVDKLKSSYQSLHTDTEGEAQEHKE